MVELHTDRNAGFLCRLYHYGANLFERRNVLVQLRVGDDLGEPSFSAASITAIQTFQIGCIVKAPTAHFLSSAIARISFRLTSIYEPLLLLLTIGSP